MVANDVPTLLLKAKSHDVDARTDAIVRLHVAFDTGAEIPEVDVATTTLDACLRTSNQHLVTASIAAIQAFIKRLALLAPANAQPLSASISSDRSPNSNRDLKHAIHTFIMPGGVIDHLNESRDVMRTLTRNTLVDIGLAAIQIGGTSTSSGIRRGEKVESIYGTFERSLREQGLVSKAWRTREQTLLVIVQLRKSYPSFPIRSYLPLIVATLEDSDSNVRDCARQSTIILFSGPGVSDAARADLKNELTKKGVRKTIVEPILAGVMASTSSAASSAGEGSDGDRAPSAGPSRTIARKASRELPRGVNPSKNVGSRPQTPSMETMPPAPSSSDVAIVYIASARDLEHEFARMAPHFEGKESEHNWSLREQDIVRIRGMLKGEAHIKYTDAFVTGLRNNTLENSYKALESLRTTLSVHAISLYCELAEALGPHLDPLVDSLLIHLIRMSGFTKKIVATNTQQAVTAIITYTSCQPRILLPHLYQASQDKNVATRQFMLGHVTDFLKLHGEISRSAIESHGGLELLEKIIKKGLSDPNPGVKAKARESFWLLQPNWPAQAQVISSALDSTALKQLDKANPNGAGVISVASTPPPKKQSAAAAIAAARAKAKAVATAPPSLRHAATSGASAANRAITSPTATLRRVSDSKPPTVTSPNHLNRRSASPLLTSPSLPRPPSRGTASRTVSGSSTMRTTPSSSGFRTGTASPSPPSSPISDLTSRRKNVISLQFEPTTPTRNSHIPKPISPPGFNNHERHESRLSVSSISSLKMLQEAEKKFLPRESLDINGVNMDESFLMAVQNPLPDDSDSDDAQIEATMRLPTIRGVMTTPPVPNTRATAGTHHRATASSPTGALGPQSPPRSQSSIRSLFPGDSVSQTAKAAPRNFTPHSPTHDVIEDAIRANAEQAESSAERLTELMEPDQSYPPTPSGSGPSIASPLVPPVPHHAVLKTSARPAVPAPVTPVPQKAKGLLSHLALFQNSPALKGTPSVMDRLYENKATSGWWLKRKTLLDAGTPLKASLQSQEQDLTSCVKALVDGSATEKTLQKLVLICNANPAFNPDETEDTPSADGSAQNNIESDIWEGGRIFDGLMNALLSFLRSTSDETVLEYGLCVIWEMVENQTSFLDESEIFSLLFHVRYVNTHPILEATSTIRDNLVGRQEPVWCLKTLHGCLLQYIASPIPEGKEPRVMAQIRAGTQAFGIIGLGKLIMRLPSEVLEDELPLLKKTLTSVLDERDPTRTTVREAAYATIVAAQSVLRDETHLFELLDGLEVSKKNLLTYYFDKHGARGVVEGVVKPSAPPALNGEEDEKVVKELIRLDVKISTPIKTF